MPLVAGAGSIGLLAAQALRARGAHVRVLEPDPGRARRAAERGFAAPAAGERFSGALLTAPARSARSAARCSSPGGQLVLFSGGAEQPLDTDLVYRRELTVRGVRSSTPRHLREALGADRERRGRVREPRRLRARSRRVRRRPGALPQPPGAQGGVRTVIAARYWAPARRARRARRRARAAAAARSCCASRPP